MTTATLSADFARHFGSTGHDTLRIIRAPGRVNLIGEHTDYNDGFVFPMAIEPQVIFVCRPRTDGKIVVRSSLFPGQAAEFSLQGKQGRGEPKWSNYVRGPIALLLERGIPLVGMDCLIVNTLPMGGGLSSSAAMEVGTTRAMLALAGQTLDATAIAQLTQKAEHTYADVPCGIMDQTIVTSGRSGHAMLLDCRDNSRQFIPLNPHDVTVVVVNSMVKHELSGGEYAQRRQQCETGVAHFQKTNPAIKALRDVTIQQVLDAQHAIGDVVFRRCRHVVGENQRCLDFAEDLKAARYENAGKLMVQSHNSLRDDYEVSTPELDYLVATSVSIKGVYGSRMTGGGFGGCTVSLVMPRFADTFISEIRSAYEAKYRIAPVIFATTATDGAGEFG
jgi:galactokinase